MKKIKLVLSFVFTLGIMCLGFSFASNNFSNVNAFAYSSQIVLENSTFDMGGGTISNAIGDNGGAVYVGEGATFTMTGGKIKNCTATNGGAVYIANGGTFVFDGGTIENCSADLGYAVYVASGGTFNYENNGSGFSGCGEDQNLHIYAEEGAIVIGPGTYINIYVDDATTPAKTMKKTGDTYTIDEAEMPLDYESCCGYFYDSKLSQCTNGVVDLTRVETTSAFTSKTATSQNAINLYTRTATASTNFFFSLDSATDTYRIGKNGSNRDVVVLPKEYEGKPVGLKVGSDVQYGAFANMTNITKIVFPDGLKDIVNYVFYGCSGLTGELVIPDSVVNIGSYAFNSNGCSGELVIPDSVETIGVGAFNACSGLTSLKLGKNLTTISGSAFLNCSNISGEVTFPLSLQNIGGSAFSGCKKITSVIVEDGSAVIGNASFRDCSGLTTITIKGAGNIDAYAFDRCTALQKVYLAGDIGTIFGETTSNCSFVSCPTTAKIYTSATSKPTGWGIYWNYVGTSKPLEVIYGCSLDSEGNIVLPPSINVYVDGSLAKTFIPGGTSYTVVESDMPLDYESCCGYFLDSELMTTIKNNTIDLSNGDVNLYTRTAVVSSDFVFELNDTQDSYIVKIPQTNPNEGGAFIPKTLTVSSVSDIVLPKEYGGLPVVGTKAKIGVYGQTKITSIVLADSIKEIGDYSFREPVAKFLETINIHDSVEIIGDNAFEGCANLTGGLIIPNSVTSISSSAFHSCTGLTSVTIGDGVTSIGNYAFTYCRRLTSVIIGNSVTSIGDDAFSYCSVLTSVTIGDNVTSIGDSAFSGCSGLTSVTIPDSVTSIGERAFNSCDGLTSVIIPDSVTSIGEKAFYGCSGLTSVYIPSTVTTI
ncbi:MAG: leucine-rich repeat domain-containing protein, partial [Clostridia bacterium]|nr:leucine-rich repeat domain-containing protein [Clostridia bacterium]